MLQLNDLPSKIIFFVFFVVMAMFLFFPMLWMLSTSFKPPGEIFLRIPTVLPANPTWQNYISALTDANIPVYLRNSLITAGGSSLLTTFLAAYAAFSFAKYRYMGRRPMMYFLLSAQTFPFAVLLITIYPMLNAWGLTNTYPGLMLAYIVFALPAGTYMLFSYFVQLPAELIEAARVDGASDLRIIHTIIFPLALPGLITVGLYAFMGAWNDLLYSLTLLTASEMRTIGPGLLLTYMGELSDDWGGAMAASIICSLPVITIFSFLQRYFIQGITAGGVKS